MCHKYNQRKCSIYSLAESEAQQAAASEKDLTKKNDFCSRNVLHSTALFWVNNDDWWRRDEN